MNKPKIFIGSSVEGLTVAYAVQQNLTHDAEITVWDQGVFELSQTSIESLIGVLDKCDFAIFVFSPDDITKIRNKKFLTVRDNVIFELGMFIGKLGRQRTFIIMPDKPVFHIPTDLLGVNAGKYDTSRTDGSYQAATGPVSHQIRTQIKKVGLLQSIINEIGAQDDVVETRLVEKKEEDNWISFYLEEKFNDAIDALRIKIASTSDEVKKEELFFWELDLEYKLNPKKGRETILDGIKSEPDKLIRYINAATILLWGVEFNLVLQILNQGLDKFPKNDQLSYLKSECYEKLGQKNLAIEILTELDVEENDVAAIKLAELYERLEERNLEEAFKVLNNAYRKNPSSEQVKYKLARIAEETNRHNIALYLYDNLTKKYPKSVTYWGYLGNTCLELNLSNKAMIAYKRAQEISDSKASWILSNIGNILNNQGFYSDSRKYFDTALELDPNSKYSFDRISSIIKNEEVENESYLKFLKEGLGTLSIVES